MASKSIYSIVAAVGIAAVAGGAYWYQNKASKPTEIGGNLAAGGVGKGAAPNSGASAPAGAGAGAGRGMPGVEIAKVEVTRLQDDAQAVGSLRSKQNVMLRPEVSGRVVQLGFTDGGRLRKGDLVVQLDDALQRAEIRQSEAQVSIARANYKRNQELVAQNFVAQRVLDESGAAMQVAEAQLSLSCARWDRMRVLAPFDGTVGIRSVNVGDYVKDGADLVNLEDLSSMFVDFRLPERFVGKLRREQGIELQLDAMPGRLFKAKIEAIDPQLDANGRAVLVRAVLPNTGGEPLAQRPQGASGAAGAPNSGASSPKTGAGSVQTAPKKVAPSQKPPARPASAAVMPAVPRALDPVAVSCAQFAAGAASRGGAGAVGGASGSGAGQGAGGFGSGRPSTGAASAGGASFAQGGAQGDARSAGAGAGSVPQAASQSTGQAPQRAVGSGGAAHAGGRPGGAPGMGGGGGPLRPGMFARVTAVFNVKDAAITIPEEAIVPQGGRQFVIRLIEQTEAQGKEIADKQAADAAKALAAAGGASAPVAPAAPAGGGGGGGGANQPYPMSGFVDGKRLVSQRVDVRLGIRRPGRVEVLEGLTETDTVVIAGQQRVQRDNTPVRVIEMGRPPGGAGAPAASNASPSSPVNATNSVASPVVSTSRPAQ